MYIYTSNILTYDLTISILITICKYIYQFYQSYVTFNIVYSIWNKID